MGTCLTVTVVIPVAHGGKVERLFHGMLYKNKQNIPSTFATGQKTVRILEENRREKKVDLGDTWPQVSIK